MTKLRLLDTNVFRALVDARSPNHESVRRRFEALGSRYVFLSEIAVGEIEYGLRLPHNVPAERVAEIRQALDGISPLGLDVGCSEPYGEMRRWLFEKYGAKLRKQKRSVSQLSDPSSDAELGIQENDLWIASHAIAVDGVLVTTDKMKRVREAARECGLALSIENWAQEPADAERRPPQSCADAASSRTRA